MPEKIRRILIAEDHPFLAAVLSTALSDAGYETEIASDGKEALSLIKANLQRYDLLMTNQNMPQLSGPELIQRLRKQKFTGKIILMTLSRPQHISKAAKPYGADVYLSKLFTPEELLNTVADLIGPGLMDTSR